MNEDAVVGVTSNPTIFDRAISGGSAYDTQLKELLARERDQLLADLQRVGVDYDDVVSTLEREGVEKFAQSYAQLLETIGQKRTELAAA